MNWILHNKEWLFSGVGVTVFLGLVSLLYRAVTAKRRTASGMDLGTATASTEAFVTQAPSVPWISHNQLQFTKPTPEEMTSAIRALPPFQQKAAREAYVGLRVRWYALFRGIREGHAATSKPWVIDLEHYDPANLYTVSTMTCRRISLDAYPEFKSMRRGVILIVSGTVEGVDGLDVELGDVRFEFTGKHVNERKE